MAGNTVPVIFITQTVHDISASAVSMLPIQKLVRKYVVKLVHVDV